MEVTQQTSGQVLNSAIFQDLLDHSYQEMKYKLVELNLPKFDVKSKYSLKKELVALGLDHLFDDRLADFSRMTASGNNEIVFLQNSCHFVFSGPIVVMV